MENLAKETNLGKSKQKNSVAKRIISSDYFGVLTITIILLVYLSIFLPGFLTVANLETLLATVGVLFIAAMGMTFILLTGGIDLSIGSHLALIGIVLSFFLSSGMPDLLAILLSIVAGGLLGAINGLLIGPLKLSFIVVTLGAMGFWRGMVYLWTDGKTPYIDSQVVLTLGGGQVFGIPVMIIFMIICFVISFIILRYTYFGRNIYAVGGNIEAARLSGIRVSKTLVYAYIYCGIFVAIAAILQSGRIGAASPTIGQDLALMTAAAVLLGGTSFRGGIGGVTGTAIGVLFMGILQNGLGVAGVSSYWQEILTGFILIMVVIFDKFKQSNSLTN